MPYYARRERGQHETPATITGREARQASNRLPVQGGEVLEVHQEKLSLQVWTYHGMRRDLCEAAKKGKLCCDDLCHGNPDDTLCGFDKSFCDEITEEYESEEYQDEDDCLDCGMCDSCIERTRAHFKEMENEQAKNDSARP